MSDGATCACLRVVYEPIRHPRGEQSDRWVCPTCGSEFYRRIPGIDFVLADIAGGLAWDLGAAQATIRNLALIADAVTAERADAIAPFLEAMGLRKEDPAESLSWVRDDDLRAECRRRGVYSYGEWTSADGRAEIHQHNIEAFHGALERQDVRDIEQWGPAITGPTSGAASTLNARRRFHAFVPALEAHRDASHWPGTCAECGMPRDSDVHASF